MKQRLLLVLLLPFLLASVAHAQCPDTDTEADGLEITGTGSTAATTPTTAIQTIDPANKNFWYTIPVVTGVEYFFSDCNTPFDPTLEARQGSPTGTVVINWDDINEASCATGFRETVYWTSGFTGTLYFGVHHFNGTWPNATSAILDYRQSSTVSNTTSTAAICTGATKGLTATVSSVQCDEDVVSWSIVSGGGSISGTTYTAGAAGSVTIRATHGVSTDDVTFNVASPSITASGGGTFCVGATPPTLTSTFADGLGTCTYQWQSAPRGPFGFGPWSDIPGETGSTYTLPAFVSSERAYRVLYDCDGPGCAPAISNIQVVTVVDPDNTIFSSTPTTVCVGGQMAFGTFSPIAGSGFRWQESTAGPGGPWTDLSCAFGGCTPFLNRPAPSTGDIWHRLRYNVSGTGCSGTYFTTAIRKTVVSDAPNSISLSGPSGVCVGSPVSYTATPAILAGCAYQWQESTAGPGGPWSNISGATSPTYFTILSSPGDIWHRVIYDCQPSTNCSDVTSGSIRTTISPDTEVSSIAAFPDEVCQGGTILLFPSITGGTSCGFQWQSSTAGPSGPWTDIPGATSPSINQTLTSVGNVWYRLELTCSGPGCSPSAVSPVQLVTVVSDPAAAILASSTPPTGTTVCPGATVTAAFTGGTGGISCSDEYQVSVSGGSTFSPYTPGDPITVVGLGTTTIVQTRRSCSGQA